MAWNKYYFFVKSPQLTAMPTVLEQLGLGQYQPQEQVPLHASNKPKTLFTGFYNNSLLLVHPDLVFEFFADEPSETEKRFVATFPGCEMAALIENSTVGLFGYALIVNGQKIRMKDGSDGQIYHDTGEQLPEEQHVLAETIFGEDELDEMRADGMSEEEVEATIRFEASWRVPNRLTKRYLGEEVGSLDPTKVQLTRYRLS